MAVYEPNDGGQTGNHGPEHLGPDPLGPESTDRPSPSPDLSSLRFGETLEVRPHCATNPFGAEELAADTAPTVDLSTDPGPSHDDGPPRGDSRAGNAAREGAAAGRHIGRFRLERVLGEGSFGTVFLAHDPQLDRKIALKVAKTGVLVRESDRIRFLREARAAAQLRHPHIVPVYEFGQLDEVHYIAYQYIRGQSLKGLLRAEQRMTTERAVAFCAKLARGLHYAHTQGIVHRDMKPDNVLVDEHGEPHITDFGCARRDDTAARQTIEGSIMGTPAYMSPEQAAGRSNEATAASDVWSLGVMLQEMMTGVLPFQGTVTEILVGICQREAPALRQLDASVPRDLETICAKCLTKNLLERFSTALELAEELERYQRGEPILSRPIGPLARTYRWAKRNQAVAGLLLAVFITLLTGTTVSSVLALRVVREARARAVAHVTSLGTANASSLPFLIEQLRPYARDVLGPLERELEQRIEPDHRRRLHLALLALSDPSNPSDEYAPLVLEDLLLAPADEFPVIRDILAPHAEPFVDGLWKAVQDPGEIKSRRFRAACALAQYDRNPPGWRNIAPDVVGHLVGEDPRSIPRWVDALLPARSFLRSHLIAQFDTDDGATAQSAAAILGQMFDDDPKLLVELILSSSPGRLAALLPHLATSQGALISSLAQVSAKAHPPAREPEVPGIDEASRVANAEMALLALGMPGPLIERLGSLDFPTIRALEIERLGAVGFDPQLLKQRFSSLSEPANGQALGSVLLALGQYDKGRLFMSERELLFPKLCEWYVSHDDPYVHHAAEWLLRHWGYGDRIEALSDQIASSPDDRRWYRDALGNTLVVCEPGIFTMGSRQEGLAGVDPVPPHPREIPRRFAVAAHEVTIGEFARYEADRLRDLETRRAAAMEAEVAEKLASLITELKSRQVNRGGSEDQRVPVTNITWYEVASYCRWLGERQGFSESEQCFPSIDEIDDLYATLAPLIVPPTVLSRTGYRLPTSAEWEYACRAGTETLRPFGVADSEVNARYAWTIENSQQHPKPTGLLKPNPLGMFDILGNACEWSFDWYLPLATEGSVTVDGADDRRGAQREIRGGSYKDLSDDFHSAARTAMRAEQGDATVGFRVARTIGVPNP